MSQTQATSSLSFAAPAVIADDASADLPQLASFDIPSRIAVALDAMREGRPVVLQDDDDRENEADLIVAAEKLTDATMALLIRECSGIVCLCLPDEKVRALELPPMAAANGSRYGTAFTVSIEAREGVTTGVSATDRVTTIRAAIADHAKPGDIVRPGHVFRFARCRAACSRGAATRKARSIWPSSPASSPQAFCAN